MIINLYTKCILSFFFNERSLSKDVAFRVDIRIIIYIKMLQKKIEQNLVRKNMKSFSRVRQQKKRNKVEKERNKKQKVIKRESDSKQGELVLFSVDITTTKKGSCFVDNRAGVASTCRWEVEATRTREIPLRRRKMTEMGK